MRLKLALAASAAAISIVMLMPMRATRAGDAVKSGLAVGDLAGPFDIDDVTGPNKGRTLCYR